MKQTEKETNEDPPTSTEADDAERKVKDGGRSKKKIRINA